MCLRINLTKNVHTCIQNYKTSLKQVKEELNKWRESTGIGRLHMIKKSNLPKLIYRFNVMFMG